MTSTTARLPSVGSMRSLGLPPRTAKLVSVEVDPTSNMVSLRAMDMRCQAEVGAALGGSAATTH